MDQKTKSGAKEKSRRARLSAWSYVMTDNAALLPGERRLFSRTIPDPLRGRSRARPRRVCGSWR